MFFDMQEVSVVEGMLAFPDFPFANLPRQEPIKEQIFIGGNDGNTIYLQGNMDNPGNYY